MDCRYIQQEIMQDNVVFLIGDHLSSVMYDDLDKWVKQSDVYECVGDKHVNLKFKITSDDGVLVKFLETIERSLRSWNCCVDLVDDVYISDAGDGTKYVLIRGKDFCFGNKKDVKYFMEQVVHWIDNDSGNFGPALNYINLSMYSDQCQGYMNRITKIENRRDIDENKLFKYSLMSYVTPIQLRVIKIDPYMINNDKHCYLDSDITVQKDGITYEELNLWKRVNNNINIVKKVFRKQRLYLHYVGKCLGCTEIHSRPSCYIRVSCGLYNVITISFRCINSNIPKRVWLNRINANEVKFTHEPIPLSVLMDIVQFYSLDKKAQISIKLDDQLSEFTYETWNDRYLNYDKFKEIVASSVNMVYLKSIEGTGKTTMMKKYIREFIVGCHQMMVIVSANISTLRSIRKGLIDDDIEHTWYGDCDWDSVKSGMYSILLITVDSLHKLMNKNGAVYGLDKIELWNDETSHTFSYINSTTLNGKRAKCYKVLEILIGGCCRGFFTCADFGSELVKILDTVRIDCGRGFDRMIIFNKFVIHCKNFHIVGHLFAFMEIMYVFVTQRKKLYVASDSKRKTIQISELLKKRFPGLKILLLNADTVNKDALLENINEVILDYDVFICSPVMSVGVNIDCQVDDTVKDSFEEMDFIVTRPFFDTSMALFTGKTMNRNGCQQILNRVRVFREFDHYLCFHNVTSVKYNLGQISPKEISKLLLQRDKFMNENGFQFRQKWDNMLNTMVYSCNNFASMCYLYYKRIDIESKADFQFFVVREILQRGAKVFVDQVSYTSCTDLDRKVESNMKIAYNVFNRDNLLGILNSPLPSRWVFSELIKKQHISLLTNEEKRMIDHYRLFNKYCFSDHGYLNSDKEVYVQFLMDNEKLMDYVSHWSYYLDPKNIFEECDIDIIDAKRVNVINKINEYLNLMRFSSILDKNRILSQNIDEELLRRTEEIRLLGRELDINIGLKGLHQVVKFISRIYSRIYGISIKKQRSRYYFGHHKRVNHYIYWLEFDSDSIIDYIAIMCRKYNNNEKVNLFWNFVGDRTFKHTDIHKFSGYLDMNKHTATNDSHV